MKKGLDGRGQTVAVIDAYSSPTIEADAARWSKAHGLRAPKLDVQDSAIDRDQPESPAVPTDVPGLGGASLQDPQGWFGEETLDVEAVHAMAPRAKIVMQAAHSPLNLFLHMAQKNGVVSRNEAQIVSNSYGGSTDDTDTTSDGYWQQAAAQGIGVYFSSGDDGDGTAGGAAGRPHGRLRGQLAVRDRRRRHHAGRRQEEHPPVRDLLGHRRRGPGQRRLAEESTFNSGGGGGTSQVYAEPKYQAAVVPSRFANYWKGNANAIDGSTQPGRVVPDVAMLGDPNSGFQMGQTQDFDAYANPDGLRPARRHDEVRPVPDRRHEPLVAAVRRDDGARRPGRAQAAPASPTRPSTRWRTARRSTTSRPPSARSPWCARTTSTARTRATAPRSGCARGPTRARCPRSPASTTSTGLGTPDGLTFLRGLAPHSRAPQEGGEEVTTRAQAPGSSLAQLPAGAGREHR